MTQDLAISPALDAMPRFAVEFEPPDLSPWRAGNAGLEGFWSFDGPAPGPHVVVTALIHGNEIAGAVALDRLLRAPPALLRGRLTVGFANLAAYARFDPAQPTASRYLDEDMNRLWDAEMLDGPRRSSELARARAMRKLIDSADVLLDLHSMLWPSESLILCGPTGRGRALAGRIGTPFLVVADRGHLGGRRLIDYAPFSQEPGSRAAVLVEGGQHWLHSTVATLQATIAGALGASGLLESAPPAAKARFAEVTQTVTACSGAFHFVEPYKGGYVVAQAGTLIAMDGNLEISTPHDACLLVMPSLRPSRGHTAVRLARFT